ncbi:glycosyl transferase family 21-domain-containing protein [Obelidium mucronatum]|nr:glycosyl transferase family 21-domain-containing protein [Obelidium mucronatum]
MVFIGNGAVIVRYAVCYVTPSIQRSNCSFLRYHFPPKSISALKSKDSAPGVSILRPLKGVDANLIENLASALKLNYPNFEILFSVADSNDPAIEVVNNLMKNFPDVPARLVVGESHFGVNPKVNNLLTSYAIAKHEIVWILDSNIFVKPDTLGRAVDCLMQSNVGLVHHIPIGVRPESFGTSVEQVYLNTTHAKIYTMVNKLRLGSCVIGKSNLFRKSELAHVGGLAYFGKFMSEDNIMGRSIWDQGRLHVIPADVVYQPLGKSGLTDYFKRRARWTRMRKFMDIGAVILEPFTECFLNAIVSSFAFSFFFGVPRIWFFLVHVMWWFIADLLLALSIESSTVTDSFWGYVGAWFIRELSTLPVHLHAVAGSSVEWRGKKFRLQPDGTVAPADGSKGHGRFSRISSLFTTTSERVKEE